MRDQPVIVGIGESQLYKRGTSPVSELSLALTAVLNACADAGLAPNQIDGFAAFADNKVHGMALQGALGIPQTRLCSMAWGGGGGGSCGALASAVSAVQTGRAHHVVVFRSVSQGKTRMGGAGGYTGGQTQETTPSGLNDIYCAGYSQPYGLLTPGAGAGLRFMRYMHEYGVGSEALAHVAVTFRQNALRNPRALMQKPMTLEDHAASRMIVHPYRLFDFCLENDGACAVIVTTAERARDLKSQPARILGVVEGGGDQWGGFSRNDLAGNNQRGMAPELYEAAGVKPEDIDVAQLYDNFTGQVLVALEEWKLCGPGEASDFIIGGGLRLDGALPANTAGGMLSEGYIQGLNLITEAVRQIRGSSTSQAKKADLVLVTGGSTAAPTSAAILAK